MLKLTKQISKKPTEIYIDAADVNEKRFGLVFEEAFPLAKIVSRHKADQHYLVVSAASIIAKVERDNAIEKLKEKVGEDFGSGYPADPKTKSFLNNIFRKNKKFPPYVRESWDTAKKIKDELTKAKKLTDFM